MPCQTWWGFLFSGFLAEETRAGREHLGSHHLGGGGVLWFLFTSTHPKLPADSPPFVPSPSGELLGKQKHKLICSPVSREAPPFQNGTEKKTAGTVCALEGWPCDSFPVRLGEQVGQSRQEDETGN